MDFPLNETIIAAAGTAVGVLLGKGIELFRARKGESREDKKVEADIAKSETAQALEMYRGLIDGLKSDTTELLAHLHQLEEERLVCREENAALRAEVKQLTERVQGLEAQLKKA